MEDFEDTRSIVKTQCNKFDGKERTFAKWELSIVSVFECKTLSHIIEMNFLDQIPRKVEVLKRRNLEHRQKFLARQQNAKGAALLTTLIDCENIMMEFIRLNDLHLTFGLPPCTCRHWKRFQEMYNPNETINNITMEEDIKNLTLSYSEDPHELGLQMAAIENKHRATILTKKWVTLINIIKAQLCLPSTTGGGAHTCDKE